MRTLRRVTPRGLALGLAALLIIATLLWLAAGEHDEAERSALSAASLLIGFMLGQEHEHEKARRQ